MGNCASYLGGNDEIVLLPAEFLDRFSEHDLGLSAGVYFGGIEEIDAGVVGDLHAFQGGFYFLLILVYSIDRNGRTIPDVSAICEPASQRDNRDFQSSPTEGPVLHFRKSIRHF